MSILNVTNLQNALFDDNVYPHGKVGCHEVHGAKSEKDIYANDRGTLTST